MGQRPKIPALPLTRTNELGTVATPPIFSCRKQTYVRNVIQPCSVAAGLETSRRRSLMGLRSVKLAIQ